MATLDDYLNAKEQYEQAKTRYDEITQEIARDFLLNEVKTELWNTDSRGYYTVTVVQSETMKFDEDTLLKELGKRAFARVANLKLDKKKLEAAVRDGSISAELVGRNTVISRNTPYIRATPYTGED